MPRRSTGPSRLAERRRQLLVDSREATKKAKVLSSAMEKRTLDMKKMVEAADLPVEGITLEGGSVYYDGVPFNQASDAEQLRVSCAIAMRESPKLRVIRVQNGEKLDEDSLKAPGRDGRGRRLPGLD